MNADGGGSLSVIAYLISMSPIDRFPRAADGRHDDSRGNTHPQVFAQLAKNHWCWFSGLAPYFHHSWSALGS